MSTYSLSGTGIQALSANVTAVHVTITTLPVPAGMGSANPTNYFHVCMLRFGDASGFFDAVPVAGGPQWLAVPNGTTRLGYACQGGSVISVAEVIGGTPPFGGPGALSSLSDVALASPADTQVLTYQASSSKWINAAASGGGGSPVSITTARLASPASTIRIPASGSLSTSYDSIFVQLVGHVTGTGASGIYMRLNGDASANYGHQELFVSAGTVAGTNRVSQTSGQIGDWANDLLASTAAGSSLVWIPDYRGPWDKVFTSLGKSINSSGNDFLLNHYSHWYSHAAITDITIFPASGTFATGTLVKYTLQ
jgi:hypothetical protein